MRCAMVVAAVALGLASCENGSNGSRGDGGASGAKEMTRFTILGVDGAIGDTSVSLTVPFGTALLGLTPTIAITGASVSPASGVAQDFSNPVTYTVTAADGTTKDYTATVSVAPDTARNIVAFTIPAQIGETVITDTSASAGTIAVTVPFGTALLGLTPTIAITGASVSPASGVAQDFSNPVTYTVTAADGTTKSYASTVSVTPPSDMATVLSSVYTVSAGGTAIESIVAIPYDISKATFLAGLTKGESHQTWNDAAISDPVSTGDMLVVTAQDGVTTVTYAVTVNARFVYALRDVGLAGGRVFYVDPAGAKLLPEGITYLEAAPSDLPEDPQCEMTPWSCESPSWGCSGTPIPGADGSAVGQGKQNTLDILAGCSTEGIAARLCAALEIANEGVTYDDWYLPSSGELGAMYTELTGVGGFTTQYYWNSTEYAASEAGIVYFYNGYVGSYGKSSSGSYLKVRCVREVAPSSAKDMKTFTVPSQIGPTVITDTSPTEGSIAIRVPYGTYLFTPTIATTGVRVSPQDGVAQDFSTPVTYRVTAADGSIKDYTVTVAPSSAKSITAFTVPSQVGTTVMTDTSASAGTVSLTVPYSADVTRLTPTISITGASVSPQSGAQNNFAAPTTYVVSAEDTTTRSYSVTVTIAPPSDVATVTSSGCTVSAGGTAIETIAGVPYGMSKATFLAELSKGESHQTWNAAAVSDPVDTGDTLVVTAEDGVTTVIYTLTVSAMGVYELRNMGPAGGRIFYVDPAGAKLLPEGMTYLEAAPNDQSAGTTWCNYPNCPATGGNATALGAGQANTDAIIAIQGAGVYAAQSCNDLSVGIYDDWYLPAKDELNRMYVNLKKGTDENGLAYAAFGGFSVYYWSSSEVDVDNVWYLYVPGGQLGNYGLGKWRDAGVRCVRGVP